MQPGAGAGAAVGSCWLLDAKGPPHAKGNAKGKLPAWPHLQQVCALSIAIGAEAVDGLGQHIQAPRLVRAVLQGAGPGWWVLSFTPVTGLCACGAAWAWQQFTKACTAAGGADSTAGNGIV